MSELDAQRTRLLSLMWRHFLMCYLFEAYRGVGFGRLIDERPNLGGAWLSVVGDD